MREPFLQVDTHVHSVLSGHAWSTLHEDVVQAARVGLRAICLTEHSVALPGSAPEWSPISMSLLPPEDAGVRIYRGLEADVVAPDGTICPRSRFLQGLDFCLVSMHGFACDFPRTMEVCTEAWLNTVKNPDIDALGHIDRAAFPCDMERVVQAARDHGKLVELNNASLIPMRAAGHENLRELIRLCRKYDAPVCIGSDAHYHTMVGDFSLIRPLLEELSFPMELIVNRTVESFEAFLWRAENKKNRSCEHAEAN